MHIQKIRTFLGNYLVYITTVIALILLSNLAVGFLLTDPGVALRVKAYKVWVDLLLIGLAIFLILRKQNNALRSMEGNFSDLFESTTEGIFRSTPNGRFSEVNAAMASIYGYASPQEMIDDIIDISTQIHHSPESRKAFTESLMLNGKVENFEVRNRKKDGTLIWTSTNARIVKDKNGRVLYFEGFVTDITKQKKAEIALQDAEARYRMLVEKLPAVVFMDIFNDPQSTQYMSPRLKDLVGYTPEEWVAGENLWENSLHPDDKERVLAEDRRTDKTGEPFRIEYRIQHRDGHYVWVKEDASIIRDEDGTPLFWQGIMLNISEQKRSQDILQRRDSIIKAVGFSAEQFLKSSNWEDNIIQVLERLGEAAQVSRVYVFTKSISSDGRVLVSQIFEWCNKGIRPLIDDERLRNVDMSGLGYSRWIGLLDQGLPVYGSVNDFPVQERPMLNEQDIRSLVCIPLQIGSDWWGYIGFDECTYEREWTEVEIEALKAAANTLSVAYERNLSVTALSNSEASYRGLFDSIHDAIYIQNRQGIFLDVNDGAANMYGYPKEFFLGKSPEFLSAPGRNDLEKTNISLQEAFSGKAQQFEFWGRRSNGEVFPKSVRAFKGTYFGQEVLIAIAQDITAQKNDEENLQRQLKELTVLHSIAIVESTARNTDELIKRVTDIIGEMLYPDNCGILLMNQKGDGLYPHPSYRGINAAELILITPLSRGVAGKVASTGRSIRIGDVSQEPAYYEATEGIQSELCIPIQSDTKIIGILNVESKKLNAFTETDEQLLSTVAGGLANAYERIQLFELEQGLREQAEILREATGELTSSFNLETLLENVFISMEKLIKYDSGSIEFIKGDYLEIVAGKNIPSEMIGKKNFYDPQKWGDLNNQRQPVIIADVQRDHRFEKFEQTNFIRGWMGIPLFSKDTVFGVLNLDSRIPDFFTEEHASIAQTFANQVSIAIENARLFEAERRRRMEAETLSQATAALANTLDIHSLYENILDWLYKITPYDSSSILVLEGNNIRISASRGLPFPDKTSGRIFPADNILCKIMSTTGEPLIIDDCEDDPRFENWGEINPRGWMGVPMLSRGQVIGYLTLDSHTPNSYTQNNAVVALTFAHQAAVSLENSRLFTETRQRLGELEIVSRVSYALRAARDANEMLPILLNEIKASVGTSSAAIWLFDYQNNELSARTTSGWFDNLSKSNFKANEGIIGKVYSSGTSYDTISQALATLDNEKFFGENKNGIAVPIRTATETIGALAVAIHAPNKIKPHQIRLVTTVAEIGGNAIYRSNLYQRSEEQIQRLTTLRELDTAISSSLDLHITLGIMTESLITKMGVDAAAVLVFNTDSQLLEYYAAKGFANREALRVPVSIGDSLASQILLNRKPLYIREIKKAASELNLSGPILTEKFSSYYATPLFSKGAARGILETYFRNPFSPTADWVDFLHTLAGQASIAIDNAQLFENLQQSNQEISLAYDTTLEGWGKALELRDKETQGHTRRVTNLTLDLARKMGIPESDLLHIRRGALLHDIGKMGIPDNILRKKGPLTNAEITEMRKHPQYAYDLLSPISYLRPAMEVAYSHHEWWNGNGYPRGLKGEEIPLSARIFAIVDVWDALSSDRPYRKAWPNKKIWKYLEGLSGKQFDPRIYEMFCKMMEYDREAKSAGTNKHPAKKTVKKAIKKKR